MERTETILVADLRAGDMTALAILVGQYQHLVYRLAIQITKNLDDANDVLQDTFLKVYDSIHSFRHDSAFETWLYRIVVNLSIDAVNRRNRRRESLFSTVGETTIQQEIDPRQDPTREAERKELREWVTQAVNSLSLNHRTVVILHELQGLSHPQIADILGCSEGTVRSRLHYARKKLRILLRPYTGVARHPGTDKSLLKVE